ncbi:hypothetical protein ACTFIU_004263 [Dictyostelium citrinum]
MVMMHDEYVSPTKLQFGYMIAVAFLGTIGVMGFCQNVFDILLGVISILSIYIGMRGVWKRKKRWLFVFMWLMMGMGFLHLVAFAVVVILHHKNPTKNTVFGFVPDIVIDIFRGVYCFGLSFFTGFIRNTLEYRRPATQMNRI